MRSGCSGPRGTSRAGTSTSRIPGARGGSGSTPRITLSTCGSTRDGSWRWKDVDELDVAIDVGFYTPEEAAAFRAEGEAVIAEWPFPTGWEAWEPDPAWPLPTLPADWDEVP